MSPLAHWFPAHAQWFAFHAGLLVLLAAELLYARRAPQRLPAAQAVSRRHNDALAATAMWVAAALLFAVYIWRTLGTPAATQFLAGYSIEEALSIDNLFVFLLLFRVFKITEANQPRVLFWGVAGAILMRGLFIAAGLGLLTRFHWVSYGFAVILLAAAIRLLFAEEDDGLPSDATPLKTPTWIRWILKIHPVSLRQDHFLVRENGGRLISMLFLALLAIEITDVIFALDSIPAVLSITRNPFLAYTSNILAVMGLRSLFFLLAAALKRLRYLHFGLAAILAFAALKMLTEAVFEVGPLASLGVIAAILAVTVGLSLHFAQPTV